MNIESIKSLFRLISGEDSCEGFMPVITLAVKETENMLLPDTDPSDVRLEFLCAAIANYRLCTIKNAQDRTDSTYGGKMLSDSQNIHSLSYAKNLLNDYFDLCHELIKPKTFTFISFGGDFNAQMHS